MKLAPLVVISDILITQAMAHDIYTGLRGKHQILCCGGEDCFATRYREQGSRFEFLTREGFWVEIPEQDIAFLPIPGVQADSGDHKAHLCYRVARQGESVESMPEMRGPIVLWCAFIPPGAM